MRILAVSDREHKALYDYLDKSRFPDIDAIISCGDLPLAYMEFLVSTFNVPSYYVRGNHDLWEPPPGWENLDGRVVRIGSLRVAGFEGCRLYTHKQAIQYTELQMWRKVAVAMPRIWLAGGVDLVVTHAPPFQLHDGGDLAHIGFKSYRWLLDRGARPRYFLHGHMHLNYAAFSERVTQVGQTQLINADGYYVLEV